MSARKEHPPVMSRGRQLIRGSALRFIQTISTIAITFVMTPYILHSLEEVYHDKEAYYGLWRLVGTFMGYYGLLDFGVSIAVSRFLSRAVGQERPQDEAEIIGTGLAIFIFISSAILILSTGVAFLAPWIVEPELVGIFRILAVLGGVNMAITLPFRVFLGVLTSRLRHDLISLSVISVMFVRYALIYIALENGYGLIAMSLANLLASMGEAGAFFGFSRLYQRIGWNEITFSRRRMRELFSYSSVTFVSTMADLLRNETNNLVITLFRGAALVTPFSFPYQLLRYADQILRAFISPVGPIFSQEEGRGDFESIRDKFLITSRICNIMTVWIFSGVALYGAPFIQRWIGELFPDTTAVLLWLTLAAFVTGLQLPSVHLLFAISRHKYYAGINVAEGVLNFAVSVALVRHFGIVGVAIGTAIPAVLLKIFVQPWFTCRAIGLPVHRYITSAAFTVLPLLLINVAFYVFARPYIQPDYLRIFVLATVQSVVYLPLAMLVGFSRRDRQYLASFLLRRMQG